jgi:ABC-type branched-subunit amino acid transport system substrate-binding protein
MRRTLSASLLLSLLALGAIPGDAAGRGPPDEVLTALEQARTDRERAIATLNGALSTARGADRSWIQVHLGEQYRLAGQTDLARARFVDTLGEQKADHTHEAARLGLALIDALHQLDSRTLHVLISVSEGEALATQNADRFLLLAVRAAGGDGGDPKAHATKAMSYASVDPELHARVAARIDNLDFAPRRSTSDTGGAPPAAPTGLSGEEADWREARRALASGDPTTARAAAARVRAATTNADRRADLDLLDQAIAGESIHWDRIGVLLPLSGRYGGVGTRLRAAIELGWSQGGGKGQLIFVDSGGTASSATAALTELVTRRGVVAVLGPVLAPETDAVVRAADAMGVPLVAMSQALENVDGYEWAFQSWLTQGQQIEVLLDHAFAREMKHFAIFAPDSDYGQRAADVFTAAVQARGGEVSARVNYEAETTNHIPFARTLAQKRSSQNFDAIFLPENATKVPIAAAALAYEEIPVGQFLPSHASNGIPLLGLSGWNHYSIIPAGGKYTLDALFTDVYVPPPDLPGIDWQPSQAWRTFTDSFTAVVGHAPTALEALAADAGAVVAAASNTGARTRLEFRDALIEAVPTVSATGAKGFDPESRLLTHEVEVLSVRPSGFRPAD